MKNLKIRLKILVAFGIVALLTLGLSGYVILSNLRTNTNAESIRAEVQLQSLSAALMDSFMVADKAGTVIGIAFNDAEYDNLLSRLEECRGYIAQMRDLIAQNPVLEDSAPQLDTVTAQCDAWSASIGKLQEANKKLESIIAAASANQEALTEQSMGIFSYQMELSIEESNQPELLPADRIDRVGRVKQGMDIAARLNGIGGDFDAMFRALDISRAEEDLAYFDSTIAVLEEFRANSSLQYNLDTTASMLEALAAYRGNIDEFLATMGEHDAMRQDASATSGAVLASIDELIRGAEEQSLTSTRATLDSNMLQLIIVIAITAVVAIAAVFLALYVSSLISKPINDMMGYIRQAGETGNLQFRDEEWANCDRLSQGKDEIGQTMKAFTQMMRKFVYYGDMVTHVSNQKLSISVETLGADDTFGNALLRMLGNLNNVFSEINAATNQVASGSGQIAQGAQSLAQGSTEQAATVQQLSASITDISEKTKANAERARQSAELAGSIKKSAEKGSRQMEEMVAAVGEINQASQNISKVMKVIDDIAFQTNILALNAAVEAARAGQHGKGFAVVAEEVRNLAAKSAEAAKDTGEMIANTIEKAELGARIANETEASLVEIVGGIGESSQIASEIAASSEEQSDGITQINNAIDQVAQVVQQNSATAEESAAASQELSGQATILKGHIAQFDLAPVGAGCGGTKPFQASVAKIINFEGAPAMNYETGMTLEGMN